MSTSELKNSRQETLREVAVDILIYLDFMAESLPQGVVGIFSSREPVALRDRLRKALSSEEYVMVEET